jgi:hypothetical protein
MDDRNEQRQELTERLERYRRLAREFTDHRTIQQLRRLEADILAKLRALDTGNRAHRDDEH